ncbi:MAG: sugar phosphate isomerase/epimerase [Spirochaetes bacterium]|nr:MAG: sugar phosphate isomerase/epimerase [Spirochaetota bacterium]
MTNPLGIHYGSFVTNWNEDQHQIIPKVKNLGFDLFEFGAPWLVEQSDSSIKEFRKIAVDNEIQLTLSLGLSTAQDISSPDASIRKVGINFLTRLARAMSKAGSGMCSGIVHGAWNGKIDSYEEKAVCWDYSVQSMKEVTKVFADEGVIFNIEVVNRFENFLINDCVEAMKYLDEVDSPQLGIHLDTFHMNIEEDSMTGPIHAAGKRLKYFHIGENNRKFPGLGNMPWKEIFSALEAADYQGPIAMEPFVRPGGEVGAAVSLYREIMDLNDYENNIRRSVAFVRALMA